MKLFSVTMLAICLFPAAAHAQKFAPVWDSYLTEISVYRNNRLSLDVEFRWKKSGGPHYHTEHQAYLLAYLEDREEQVKELCKDRKLLNKKSNSKLVLEALLEKKLAVLLETKVGAREKRAEHHQDEAARRKADRLSNTYPFDFQFENSELFKALSKLPGFDSQTKPDEHGYTYYQSKFKLLVFIPVNDCKYADKVHEGCKGKFDFTHYYEHESLAQQLRPLPYGFEFKRIRNGELLVYID